MFGVVWLVERGALPKARLEEYYVSYVADLFRTLRFGTGEAHARAEMMECNYLLEQKALAQTDGRYAIDFGRMPAAMESLQKELLEIEATGDRARAERWFARYDQMPPHMAQALATAGDVPVDIDPIFSFADRIR
jgi:membrane peptidoglycan carboxypeptidase